jgi:hypothetical protein
MVDTRNAAGNRGLASSSHAVEPEDACPRRALDTCLNILEDAYACAREAFRFLIRVSLKGIKRRETGIWKTIQGIPVRCMALTL